MKFDFLGPRDCLNQCLRSRLCIIRSNKVAYDVTDGELFLGKYTEFCRITSALSKNFKSLLGWGYPRVARRAYAGVFRSIWSPQGNWFTFGDFKYFTYLKATEEPLE